MRGCVTKLVVLVVLVGLFSYLALPRLAEYAISQQLQGTLGAQEEPDVEVSSSFPPELLLGRVDRVRVSTDQMTLQGVAFYGARADLRNVEVSVASLLDGAPRIQAERCSLGARAPAIRIDDTQACLGYLGVL